MSDEAKQFEAVLDELRSLVLAFQSIGVGVILNVATGTTDHA